MKIAIVVGMGSYNDIGIIRSCGEAGIRSIYINTKRFDIIPIWKSKYIIEFHYLDTDKEIVEFICNKANSESINQFYLFGASDAATLLFDRQANKFPQNVVCQHAQGRMEYLMDKDVMGQMALQAGLYIPSTRKIQLQEVDSIPALPVILKPTESINGNKSDITICHTETDYLNAIKLLIDKGYSSILEQQYVHSPNSIEMGITGISYANGVVEFFGYIDKIRNRSNINNFGKYYPNKELKCREALTRFISLTGYVGIFDTDFILDNDTMYFIECNFRNGAYGYSVTAAGYNMPEHFINEEPMSKRPKLRNICFMEERTDILNVLDKTMTPLQWFRDFVNTDTFLWWNRRDPKPILRIPHSVKRVPEIIKKIIIDKLLKNQ